MSLLHDADNAILEKPDRTWFGRLKESNPELAAECVTFRAEWHQGKRKDRFPTISAAARFIKRYGVEVSVQEIGKWFRETGE